MSLKRRDDVQSKLPRICMAGGNSGNCPGFSSSTVDTVDTPTPTSFPQAHPRTGAQCPLAISLLNSTNSGNRAIATPPVSMLHCLKRVSSTQCLPACPILLPLFPSSFSIFSMLLSGIRGLQTSQASHQRAKHAKLRLSLPFSSSRSPFRLHLYSINDSIFPRSVSRCAEGNLIPRSNREASGAA